ncbi:hypothetical protein, partial [Nocardia carnea]|uniref:hypothetical protein n=1 Tax=Nocardia carnea TaxID=37328 RepID=UPI003D78077F
PVTGDHHTAALGHRDHGRTVRCDISRGTAAGIPGGGGLAQRIESVAGQQIRRVLAQMFGKG